MWTIRKQIVVMTAGKLNKSKIEKVLVNNKFVYPETAKQHVHAWLEDTVSLNNPKGNKRFSAYYMGLSDVGLERLINSVLKEAK